MKEGDKVQWIHLTPRANGMRMSRREGTITRINGPSAVVRSRNGRERWIFMEKLSLADGPCQLHGVLKTMAGES